MAYLSIVAGVASGILPPSALLALLTAWLAYEAYRKIRAFRGDVALLVPALGKNVVVTLATPALLFLGILIARI
jgi:1,4-dihydroxy-2-naphthoate octaprenyltransferase